MALYSFCVRKKGTDNYVRANARHELAFLDYFAMRFNSKEELMKFLGADPQKYDDIAITYQSNHEFKILPIYFDAKELDQILGLMIDISKFSDCKNIYEIIALAYNNPKMLTIKKIPEVKTLDEITRAALEFKKSIADSDVVDLLNSLIKLEILELGDQAGNYVDETEVRKYCLDAINLNKKGKQEELKIVEKLTKIEEKLSRAISDEFGKRFGITGVRVQQIEDKLDDLSKKRYFETFKIELMKSYLTLRRSYVYLRENGLLKGKRIATAAPKATMQEVYQNLLKKENSVQNESQGLHNLSVATTSYENNLIQRCLSNNEVIADEAWDELMQFDFERLEHLSPIIEYIRSVRGNMKTIGTVD